MLYLLHLCFLLQITQADFELTKHAQENSKLRSKLVKSPEKVQVRHLPFLLLQQFQILSGNIYSVT
jgi:hypothetical protein